MTPIKELFKSKQYHIYSDDSTCTCIKTLVCMSAVHVNSFLKRQKNSTNSKDNIVHMRIFGMTE